MSSFAKLVWSFVLASAVGATSSAYAQTYCFPNAVGVPGQQGAPISFKDPRWNGAMAVVQGDGNVEFRGLTYVEPGQKSLVLSWHVRGDFGSSDNVDRFLVELVDDSTSPPTGNLLWLQRKAVTTTAGGTVASGALSARIYRYAGLATAADWTRIAEEGFLDDQGHPLPTVGTMPAWLREATLTDLECTPDGCPDWTVTLKVPLSATATQDNPATGIKLANRYRFSYQAQIHQPLLPSAEEYRWPEGIAAIDFDAPSFPTVATLAQIQSQGGPDPCSVGISIMSSQITVEHGGLPAGRQIALTSPNTFRARPLNGLSSAVPAGAVEASFRIADFSSQGQPAKWEPVRDCGAAHSAATNAVAPGGQFDISCEWTLTQEEKCKYSRATQPAGACNSVPVADDRSLHQCVLVELRGTKGAILPAGAFFSKQSAYQNMDFVEASTFSRATRLDVHVPAGAALSPALLARRDTYLFVETKNMPAAVPAAKPNVVARPHVLKAIRNPELAMKLEKLGVQNGRIDREVSTTLREQLRLGKVSETEIAEVLPTYIVHVYRDTGRTVKIKGKDTKILTPLPSFGYFVSHDGPLTGWKYGIQGATRIGPNLFRVNVPVLGGRKIESWLQACETKNCK